MGGEGALVVTQEHAARGAGLSLSHSGSQGCGTSDYPKGGGGERSEGW